MVGQAPGTAVHETGIPFNDPSGDRLRDWMGATKTDFYDSSKVAILPMGFCYPGAGKSGDLPPRPECAPAWRQLVLDQAFQAHPERFVNGQPTPPELPQEVWINPPQAIDLGSEAENLGQISPEPLSDLTFELADNNINNQSTVQEIFSPA